jgi:hypothetical protein
MNGELPDLFTGVRGIGILRSSREQSLPLRPTPMGIGALEKLMYAYTGAHTFVCGREHPQLRISIHRC